jgi:hypothetical protein
LSAEGGAYDDKLTGDWLDDVPIHVEGYAFAAVTGESEALEPQSLAEAKKGSDWPLWEKAIKEELAALHCAGTWKLVGGECGWFKVGLLGKKECCGKCGQI